MKNEILRGEKPKRNVIVEIIAATLLIFFVHTFISSFIQLQSLKNLLAFYTKYTTETAWLMIASELLISILLFMPRLRKWGLILVIPFAILGFYIVVTHYRYPNDFGGLLNTLSSTQQLVLYCLLFALALSGLLSGFRKQKSKTEKEPSVVFT
ncbi:hypothetical protein [Niastella sp. OAS944]|uniref:hypothetical protein n=1 Tax=Niastella sp. OAS944 TaxID=2664089 RepID=UPI00346B654F|nr:glucan phosphoethanolaminetransferase (alkaline phosphatase superfamily) [Chitinophagaceae bacterium OAS944]